MKPVVTRRTLLRSIGLAGGAGVMFESMRALGLVASPDALATPDYRPPTPGDLTEDKRGKKIVILGAGMAGLVTAYELGKAGYDCVLLEAKNRVGGRNWTVRGGTRHDGEDQTARFSDGQYLNAGPARLPQSHITLDYCRELGVPLEVFTNQNANALIHNEQTGVAPQRFRTAKADVYGYVSVAWPDRTTGEYALLNKPAGRVYFAGDWLSYHIAWQAGAIDSARYVVTNLHRRVAAG